MAEWIEYSPGKTPARKTYSFLLSKGCSSLKCRNLSGHWRQKAASVKLGPALACRPATARSADVSNPHKCFNEKNAIKHSVQLAEARCAQPQPATLNQRQLAVTVNVTSPFLPHQAGGGATTTRLLK